VKKFIDKFRDGSFRFEQPFFYNNKFSLRCELGIGNKKEYMKNAYKRAVEIFNIVFPNKPDFFVVEHEIDDISQCLRANSIGILKNNAKAYYENLVDLKKLQSMGDSELIKISSFTEEEKRWYITLAINRFIIFPNDNKKYFDDMIKSQVGIKQPSFLLHRITNFGSLDNDCVLTIYDDRGLDIVFSSKEKGKPFYEKLKPYLFEYDIEIMKKTFE